MGAVMESFALLWLPNILVLGLSVWFARHVVKNFGWSGLLLKFALLIDGLFLACVIAVHQTPWVAVRNHPKHIDDASVLWAMGVWFVFYILLIFDSPMRWLMQRPVKWALNSGAALVFIGAFCAGRGWL
jgi:hypothetical protein